MLKRYGGVDNKKGLDEIQEAILSSASENKKSMRKKPSFLRRAMLVLITYSLVELLLISVGVYEKTPSWLFFLLPLTPIALWVILHAKAINQKEKALL